MYESILLVLPHIPNEHRKLVSVSDANSLGQEEGQRAVTLTIEQIPEHNHFSNNPALLYTDYAAAINQTPTASGVNNIKGAARSNSVGGGQSHSNMSPSLHLNQIIKI